eukprot:7605076-Alexandrium_andersonii.AAC.1
MSTVNSKPADARHELLGTAGAALRGRQPNVRPPQGKDEPTPAITRPGARQAGTRARRRA